MRFFSIILLAAFVPFLQPESASQWLLHMQRDNGGWSDGLTNHSGPGITADAIIALWSSGIDITTLDPNPITYLRDYINQNATTLTPGLAAKLILAGVIVDQDVTNFGGVNLIDTMLDQSAENALVEESIYIHCLAMIAAHAVGVDMSADGIQQNINPDGGWGFVPGATSDTSTTALCTQALIGQGIEVQSALDYFRAVQNADAGWTFQKPSNFSTATDSYSTAVVIMALLAAGENLADWGSPLDILGEFQTNDGSFLYTQAYPEQDRLLATTQVIPALAGRSLLDIGASQ